MKDIKTTFWNHRTICTLKLGSIYRLTSANPYAVLICRFINTSAKGFNMLNVRTSKCIFRKGFYQTDSAKKKVGPGQRIFEMALPDNIRKVQEMEKHDTYKKFLEEFLEEEISKADRSLVKKHSDSSMPRKITNPLQRIEL